ncbi:hypothetical protein quinque_011509 [Culex quinquefasciatus]
MCNKVTCKQRPQDKISADQTPASSWWNSHISDSLPAAKNYFQATHGLVQTHPSFGKTGPACQVCTPNATNTVWSHCQCVLADGVERGILTANRMIPGPSIQVCENDKVVIDVENHMEGMELTIHWHGLWQKGTQYYDGVPFVTQCPIQQGNTFR